MSFTFLQNLSSQSDGLIFILFLSFLVLLLILLLSLHKSSILTISSNERGRLRIRKHALQRLLEELSEGVGGILSSHVHISLHKQKFNVRVRLKTSPDAKIEAIQGYLFEEISSIMEENLGIHKDRMGKISIEVTNILPKENSILPQR